MIVPEEHSWDVCIGKMNTDSSWDVDEVELFWDVDVDEVRLRVVGNGEFVKLKGWGCRLLK